jgi:phospholipid N-methyltransferase
VRDKVLFLREFVRSPIRTAAVAPSSRTLAAKITAPVPAHGAPVVVELGPGTGSFTQAIRQRLAGRGRHVAIELNPRMAEALRRRFPDLDVVCADASELPHVLADRGLTADVVVSGLPWVAFPTDTARPLLSLVAGSLTETGVFTQFTYAWTRWAAPARRQVHSLRHTFEEVVSSRTVWRNLPPAVIYVARRRRLTVDTTV